MTSIDLRKGALRDPNAYFVCIGHDDTPKLIAHLRAHKVKFTVDVEPEPPEGQSNDDIFWFESTADVRRIQTLIRDVIPEK